MSTVLLPTDGVTVTDESGKQTTLYKPHPKQLEFHSRTEPNVLFWGGRGSGKSLALRWEAHIRALSTPNFVYAILRRTYPELQRSHLVHVPKEMKQLGGFFHHQNKVAMYPNGSRGFFSHCQSDEDVLNLLSAEFAWMGFDELSTFEWDMFTKLSASVRVPADSGLTAMVRGATNPLGPSAQQILQYFVNKDVDPEEDADYNPEDWHSIHANADDNPSLDLEQYSRRFSGLASHVKKAWVDGEFVLENALFDFYPTKKIRDESGAPQVIPYHVIDGQIDLGKIIENAQIYRAIDVGWFPDPTVCLWIAHLGNRHIVIHEKMWWKTIAADIAKEIKEIDESLDIRRVVMTYCDPTMDVNTTADVRTVKDIFEECGIPMEKSINDRELFASTMHTFLAEEAQPNVPRLQIYRKGCERQYLIKTIPMQRFNPKRPLAMADNKQDHAVIACCYYLMSHASDTRRPVDARGPVVKPWLRPRKGDHYVLGSEAVRNRRP